MTNKQYQGVKLLWSGIMIALCLVWYAVSLKVAVITLFIIIAIFSMVFGFAFIVGDE